MIHNSNIPLKLRALLVAIALGLFAGTVKATNPDPSEVEMILMAAVAAVIVGGLMGALELHYSERGY